MRALPLFRAVGAIVATALVASIGALTPNGATAGAPTASFLRSGAPPAPGLGVRALDAAARSLDGPAGSAQARAPSCPGGPRGAVRCGAVRAAPSGASVPNDTTWTNLSSAEPIAPSGRILGSMVWDAGDGYVLLFGGCPSATCDGTMDGDTWIFVHGRWSELDPGAAPSPRGIAQMAYDAADHEVVLFGGLPSHTGAGVTEALNDTWAFSRGVWTNFTPNLSASPPGRYRGTMTYDAADGYVLLYGGSRSTAGGQLNDTWSFVHGRWTNLTPSVVGNPGERFRAGMAYDPSDGYVVLFGGSTATAGATPDTWSYRAGHWTNLSNTSDEPGERVYAPLVADPALGGLVLIDGAASSAGPPVGGTWLFGAGRWTNLSLAVPLAVLPPARGMAMGAWDGADNGTLLFGGFAGGPAQVASAASLNDSWFLGGPVFADAAASPDEFDVGRTTTIAVEAVSPHPPYTINYSGLPDGCSGGNVSDLSCDPSAAGDFSIEVRVVDASGNATTVVANLSVMPSPRVASFTVRPAAVTLGAAVNFSIAGAAGIAPYAYAFSELPSGCVAEGRAWINCTPTSTGRFTVFGEVSDSGGESAIANVTLTVNAHPSVTAFGASPAAIDLGQTTTFNASFTGGTPPFRVDYRGLPTGCPTSNTTSLSCTPNETGRFEVAIDVGDASGWDATATTVLAVAPALVMASSGLEPGVLDAGGSFVLWFNATGGTAPYSYGYNGSPANCPSVATSELRCTAVAPGRYSILASVTDAVGVARSLRFFVTVNPLPALSPGGAELPPTDAGVPLRIGLNVSGGTPPLAFSYLGLPTGCGSADLLPLPCTPTVAGAFTVQVVVTDALGASAVGTVRLDVQALPTILGFNATPSALRLGANATFVVAASGGVGPLSYAYSGLPAGCAGANLSTLKCAPTVPGSYAIGVTATDVDDRSARAIAELLVAAPLSPSSAAPASPVGTYELVAGVGLLGIGIVVLGLVVRQRRHGDGP